MGGISDIFNEPILEDQDRQIKRYRPVIVSAVPGESVDRSIVSYELYNSFNYSPFLPSERHNSKLTLGITSPDRGEGKTTAACNLSAAIAMGTGMKTIVIDFNILSPTIHEVFGIPPGPGLAEAMSGGDICVVPTQLENLFAMQAGNRRLFTPAKFSTFREVLASLNSAFEFVLVDLPPAMSRVFPTAIANQLGGLIVVVRQKMTKKREIGRVLRKIPRDRVVGFVMNHVDDNDF